MAREIDRTVEFRKGEMKQAGREIPNRLAIVEYQLHFGGRGRGRGLGAGAAATAADGGDRERENGGENEQLLHLRLPERGDTADAISEMEMSRGASGTS